MKEYVYLDSDLVNSYLAQIDAGILTKLISGQESTDTHQEDGGEEITNMIGTGASIGVAKGEGSHSKKEIDKFSTVYSTNNSELIETALADYSVDVLIQKLRDKNKLNLDIGTWKDGDLVFYSGNFDIFNFEQLKESVKKDNLQNVLEDNMDLDKAVTELGKISSTPQNRVKHEKRIHQLKEFIKANDPYYNFSNVLKFANYSSVLFPDTILIRVGNTHLLCSKDFIRINMPILTLLSQTTRQLTVLGIALTQRNEPLAPKEGEQLASDVIASTAPAIFTDIIMDSFDLLKSGDYYIRPIAIYFDQQ